jgi:iron(III) transport system ATP-binding protein
MVNILELIDISKEYGSKAVIRSLSFSLGKQAIGCLLGPSGCGKTTMLRVIAGFERPEHGRIIIGGRTVSGPGCEIPPEDRRIGMVFQDYALFPHLSIEDNVAFGLSGFSSLARAKRVGELLELVGLTDTAKTFPHELSGGQQQRVALARALAPRPELLLMDEPFSNLDVLLRERLSIEVRSILKEYGTSALMVTHNQNEAFAMADVIGVVNEGRLAQWDTAYNLYHRPSSPWIADFVGEGVLLPGRVIGDNRVQTPLGMLAGRFTFPCRNGCRVDVLIRPEDVIHDHGSGLNARIMEKRFRGANILYSLQLSTGDPVLALVQSHHDHPIGQFIGIRPQVDEIILFERHQHEPTREAI